MSVSLSKGQTISLVKASGGTLTNVRMGLGWDARMKKGLFGGTKAQAIDLDASALLFDAEKNLVDTVWFRQLRSKDGAVVHTGDNVTGLGDGDDESILVDLQRVSQGVASIVFVVNSFTGDTFSEIENATCRLVDSNDESELARFELSGSGSHTASVMAKVFRDGPGWSMKAIGQIARGRTFHDLLPVVSTTI